jgi:hypothetical protein
VRWLRRLPVLAAVLAVGFVCCTQTRRTVTQPHLVVNVRDAAGHPVPSAQVLLYYWSYPYAQVNRVTRLTTDAQGRLVLEERTENETVMPFCMHGVPEHHHTVCAAGRTGWSQAQVEGQSELTLTLAGGTYAGECENPRKLGLSDLRGGDGGGT